MAKSLVTDADDAAGGHDATGEKVAKPSEPTRPKAAAPDGAGTSSANGDTRLPSVPGACLPSVAVGRAETLSLTPTQESPLGMPTS